MKRKQFLLLVWILVGLVCASGAVYVGGRALLLRRALILRGQGLAAMNAGDDVHAADLLLQYIHRRPRDTDAIKSYLQCRRHVPMTTGQEYAETVGALKLLMQQEPPRLEDQRYLLELYARLERGSDAVDVADAILKKLPGDARTLELKTQVLIQMRQYQEALQCAERWAASSPDDLNAQITRLNLYFQIGRPPESIIADAQSLAQAHPGDAKFEVLQGFAFARAGKNPQAMQWLQTASKHTDLSDAVVQVLAEQFDALGDSPDALKALQDRVNRGGAAELRHMLAERLWEQRRWAAAAEALGDVKASDPAADPTLLALKAICLVNLNRAGEAAACRTALASAGRPDAHAWAGLLGTLLDKSPSDDKQLAQDCRAAIAFNPVNPYLECFLGECEVRLGELDLAIGAFSRSASEDVHWNRPAVRLVDCLLDAQQTEQALNIALIIAGRKPYDAATAITLAKTWAAGIQTGAAGQTDRFFAFITEAEKQLPEDNGTLPLIKMQVLAWQGKKAEAIQAARDAISRTPAPPAEVFEVVARLSRQYHLGIEDECFSAWQRAEGVTSALAYLQAIDEFSAGRPSQGLQLFDRLAAQSGKGGDVDWTLDRTQYLDAIGDPSAKAAWVRLRDAYPNNLNVQQAALNARAVRGDWQFLQPVIDRLHALTGDNGLAWRLAEASLMIDAPRGEDDYEKGSVELNSLIEMYPQLDQPHVLLAEALVHMKRYDGAINHLTTATKLNPASVSTSLLLVSLLQSRGNTEQAAAELERISHQPMSPQQREEAAALLARGGNTARAIEVLEEPRGGAPSTTLPAQDDSQDLLLASLYRQQRRPDKAETIVRDLLHRPNLAVIEFASSLFLADGRPDDARKALALLDGLGLKPGIKELVLGNFYYGPMHDLPQAQRWFAAATRQAPANLKAWRSLAVCQMAEGQPAESLATIGSALAANPGDADLRALNGHRSLLVDAGSDDELRPLAAGVLENPSDSVAIDLIGVVLNGHRANDLAKLAPRLKQFCDQHPDYAPAELQLVQCYLDMGEPGDALATAQHAMAIFPNDADLSRAAVQACSVAHRWPEMESAAEDWKSRAPESAESADAAAATAEVQLQQFDGALARLGPYLPSARQDPDHHGDVVKAAAAAYAGEGNAAAISDLLWPLARQSAAWRERWVETVIQIPDPLQATSMLDRVDGIIPADALAERAGVAQAYDFLGRQHNDAALIARATAEFSELASNQHAGINVLLPAAAQAERNGRPAVAETLYRRILAIDPNTWIVKNNLAMLIANRGGDLKEAEALAQSAVQLQPREPNVYDTLGRIESKEGNPRAAAQTMRVAVQLNPDNAAWRVSLARYLLSAGELAQASDAVAAIDTQIPDLQSQSADVLKELADLRRQIHGKGT